jgi:nucleoside-diphosphate-sugar epimerase
MTVFLTGSTGFVGRNLLSWLVRTQPDINVTCLVRDVNKANAQWKQTPANVTWLAGDLLEPATYARAVQQADCVFHTAALVSLRDGPEFYRMNTEATQHLVDVLKDSTRLQRLVFVGSISAIDRLLGQTAIGPLTEDSIPSPNTDYGKSKLQASALVKASGLPYVIMRPSYIYGPHPRLKSSMDRLIHDVAQGKRYTRFPFPGRVGAIFAPDLAEMLWIAAHHPQAANETFFIANPEPSTVADVFADVAAELGVPYSPMPVSAEAMPRFHRLMRTQDPKNLMLRILFEDYFLCSAEKWYRLVGQMPRHGYREGLARTVAWYRQHGHL